MPYFAKPVLYYSLSLAFTIFFHDGPNNESVHRSQEASKDSHAPRSAFFSSSSYASSYLKKRSPT